MELMRNMLYSTEAEEGILGCIINNKDKLQEVIDIVKEEDFYLDKNKNIYKLIKSLDLKDINVDLITLLDEGKKKKKVLEKCGGVSYISNIGVNGAFNSNLSDYIRIVKEKSHRRKLIRIGNDIVKRSYDEEEIDNVVNSVEESLYKITSSTSITDVVAMNEAVEEALKSIEVNYKNGGAILGKTTGYKELDESLSGLQKGDFIVIAARPSMGKTAFALNIGQYTSKEASVAIFSLEMTRVQLMERLLASKCLIPLNNIKKGNFKEEDLNKILMASNDLAKRNIYIDDKTTSFKEIKAKCRYLKVKKGLDVVIIDYLQLIEGGMKNSFSREQEIALVSRQLKKLAKSLDITIIALSQLSRAPEQRFDHRPILSDLRESGAIEQDADIIMMLYRDEYYNKKSVDKNIAEIIINKNRNGEIKTIKLGWLGEFQRFAPLRRKNNE